MAPAGNRPVIAYAASTGTITATTLYVRKGPGTNYDKVQVNGSDVYIKQNAKITIEKEVDDWYYTTVTFGGKTVSGYVSGQYVSVTSQEATPTSTPNFSEEEDREGLSIPATVSVNELNVRKTAGTVGTLLTTLKRGNQITVTGITHTNGETWYQITYKSGSAEKIGYVYANYVTLRAHISRPTATPKPTATATPAPSVSSDKREGLNIPATIIANRLNVREKAGTTHEVLAILLNTAKVTVNGYEYVGEDRWYHITFQLNGETKTGYVIGQYVQLSESIPTITPTAKPTVAPTATLTATPTLVPTATLTVTPMTTPVATNTPKPTQVITSIDEMDILYRLDAVVSANQLNLRKGPSVSYDRIAELTKGDTVVVVSDVMQGGSRWYRISTVVDGEELNGYVLSDYIKLDYNQAIHGIVISNKVKLNSTASANASYVKKKDGNLVVLKDGDQVTLLQETVIAEEKWFQVSVVIDDETVKGYMPASKIMFEVQELEPTVTPTEKPELTPTPEPTPTKELELTLTPEPTPTKEPELTPTSEPTPTPTKEPEQTVTPEPTEQITPTATVTPSPTPTTVALPAAQAPIDAPGIQEGEGYAYNPAIKESRIALKVRPDQSSEMLTLGGDSSDILTVEKTTKLFLYGVYYDTGGLKYRHVGVEHEGIMYYGYILELLIHLIEPEDSVPDESVPPVSMPEENIPDQEIPDGDISLEGEIIHGGSVYPDFEMQLEEQGFPESYLPALRRLHELYPNWVFQSYHTGLSWDEVIEEESIVGKNLIPNSKGIEWKSLEAGAYNWKTDSFIVYDGSTWVTASKEAIAYYMDPRNFLDEKSIFQFEMLTYESSYQNKQGVENILKYTPLYGTSYNYIDETGAMRTISYADTFIEAAEYTDVSPYHLASRVKQEVVTGTSTVSNSVTGTVAGFEGFYNFYNIGAYHSTAVGGAVANGLKYAKYGSTDDELNDMALIPWENRYNAIVGGAYILGSTYISRGQNTIYLQKFNVTETSTYYHQYMANVEAPYAEGKKTAAAYSELENLPIVFSIPVYLDMPEEVCTQPELKLNPNNLLSNLLIQDMEGNSYSVTPTFDGQKTEEYSLIVENHVDCLDIKAETVSKKADVEGDGMIRLEEGYNEIIISVFAENGDVREYIITIIREI